MPVQPSLFDNWPEKRYRRRWGHRNQEVWRTAVHEAGHAVMAHVMKVPFVDVTIRPSLGRVLGHMTPDTKEFLRCELEHNLDHRLAYAAVLVAGVVAEKELAFVGHPFGGSDYERLKVLFGGEAESEEGGRKVILAIEQRVREFLVGHSGSLMVYRLAVALTKRITLSHADAVCAMMGDLK